MFNKLAKRTGGLGRGGSGQGKGRGMGGGNKAGVGPAGACICPKCGYREEHTTGERCLDRKCPKCGTQLVRE